MPENIDTLALFDLDGTLTDRDTFLDLLAFSFGTRRVVGGLLVTSPWTLSYALGLCTARRAKERVFRHFFGGMPESSFVQLTTNYSLQRLPDLFRRGALERIRWHREQGHAVYIVSASIRHWIKPWAIREQIGVIATEVEIRDGVLTGRFSTPNCRGDEKVRRIRASIDVEAFRRIYAYGDTPHDRPMLAMATDPIFQPFRD